MSGERHPLDPKRAMEMAHELPKPKKVKQPLRLLGRVVHRLIRKQKRLDQRKAFREERQSRGVSFGNFRAMRPIPSQRTDYSTHRERFFERQRRADNR